MGEPGSRSTRRSFLRIAGAASVVGVGALAGCNDVGDSQPENVEDVPEERFEQPQIPEDQREGLEPIADLRQVHSFERLGGLATVTAYVDGTTYDVTEVTDTVAEKTMGQLDEPLVVFFAAKANVEGTASSFASAERIAERATPAFRDELESQGVEDVEEVDPRDPLPDVDEPSVAEFRGTYETSRVEHEATLPNDETLPLVVPSQSLEMAAFQSVWKPDEETALIVGGGYPNENFETRESSSVTGEEGDGIDVEMSIDLGLDPEAYRQRLVALAESVR